jgi:hypothetical protein
VAPIDPSGLRRLVDGDLRLLPDLRETSPDELVRVAHDAPDLVVTVDALTRVFEARKSGSTAAADTWRWAKLLLHKTHPYVWRSRGPEPDPDDLAAIREAMVREMAPEFELSYEDGHDRGIAAVLGELYGDRGDDEGGIDSEQIDQLLAAVREADPPPDLIDLEDGLEIAALVGGTVTEVEGSHERLRLRVGTERGDFTIDGHRFDVASFEPQDLRGAVVERCVAHELGPLEIDFAGGFRLVARPDPDYEGWEVMGRLAVMSQPGGDLAIVDDDPRSTFRSDDYGKDMPWP